MDNLITETVEHQAQTKYWIAWRKIDHTHQSSWSRGKIEKRE